MLFAAYKLHHKTLTKQFLYVSIWETGCWPYVNKHINIYILCVTETHMQCITMKTFDNDWSFGLATQVNALVRQTWNSYASYAIMALYPSVC